MARSNRFVRGDRVYVVGKGRNKGVYGVVVFPSFVHPTVFVKTTDNRVLGVQPAQLMHVTLERR